MWGGPDVKLSFESVHKANAYLQTKKQYREDSHLAYHKLYLI